MQALRSERSWLSCLRAQGPAPHPPPHTPLRRAGVSELFSALPLRMWGPPPTHRCRLAQRLRFCPTAPRRERPCCCSESQWACCLLPECRGTGCGAAIGLHCLTREHVALWPDYKIIKAIVSSHPSIPPMSPDRKPVIHALFSHRGLRPLTKPIARDLTLPRRAMVTAGNLDQEPEPRTLGRELWPGNSGL